MKKIKRIIATTLSVLSLASCMTVYVSNVFPIGDNTPIIFSLEAEAASGRLYDQNNAQWKNVVFTKYSRTGNSMYTSGCGIFSFCNAIYQLNGMKPDAKEVATWAVNNGSYQPGNGGLYRDAFYNKVQNAFGSRFRFRLDGKFSGGVKDTRLITHLRNGGVAVIHVPGHFMALTGYNGNYHVIESAVYSGRGLAADSWVSASKLCNGSTKVDWYVLISKTDPTPSPYFPKYTGKSGSIADALKAVGADGSFSNRQKIAAANGIGNYTGSASQNTSMLNKLKAGTLIKPGVTPSRSYFPKYTGKSGSIVEALKAVGAYSSYSYRQKIASANNIGNYSGSAAHNTTMLNKLKAGNLIKP